MIVDRSVDDEVSCTVCATFTLDPHSLVIRPTIISMGNALKSCLINHPMAQGHLIEPLDNRVGVVGSSGKMRLHFSHVNKFST